MGCQWFVLKTIGFKTGVDGFFGLASKLVATVS
jgi:hypothetical protein